jgi:hypothetical protein
MAHFDAVERDAGRLIQDLDDGSFNRHPPDGGWSPAQCLDHLAITTTTYIAAMEKGLSSAEAGGGQDDATIRPGLFARWFVRVLEPPVRFRAKAARIIVPAPTRERNDGWRRFVEANDAFRAFVRRTEGAGINRIRFPNPFAPVRFTVATGLAAMLAHHRRHVCQMERAIEMARG